MHWKRPPTAPNDMAAQLAAEYVIKKGMWQEFGIAPVYVEWIKRSWEKEEITLVGRFDLAYDGSGPPKLLEYNADTPTSLLEAAVAQWFWMKDVLPGMDQFNSIHDRLIEAWKRAKKEAVGSERIYFTAFGESAEDYITINYLRDTAIQGGLDTEYLDIGNIGWNQSRAAFVNKAERVVKFVCKLYPWEWMMDEAFGVYLPLEKVRWIEAPWKAILSHKAILTVLWDLFPQSPYLLPASLSEMEGDVVRKPGRGREGSNVVIRCGGQEVAATDGEYEGPWVWQRYQKINPFAGNTPVIGSWLVNGYACGIGIREDATAITGNLSRFVPHVFGL